MQLFFITISLLLTFTSHENIDPYLDFHNKASIEQNDSVQSSNRSNKSSIQIEAIDTTIMCFQGFNDSELVFRNQTEYKKLLEIRSPHPDCSNYTLPPINFEKYILIGIIKSSGGDYLTFDKQIFFNADTFIIDYQITQHGQVEVLNEMIKFFIIENIGSKSMVEFNYTKKYEEE